MSAVILEKPFVENRQRNNTAASNVSSEHHYSVTKSEWFDMKLDVFLK